jgi:hypothetical protein
MRHGCRAGRLLDAVYSVGAPPPPCGRGIAARRPACIYASRHGVRLRVRLRLPKFECTVHLRVLSTLISEYNNFEYAASPRRRAGTRQSARVAARRRQWRRRRGARRRDGAEETSDARPCATVAGADSPPARRTARPHAALPSMRTRPGRRGPSAQGGFAAELRVATGTRAGLIMRLATGARRRAGTRWSCAGSRSTARHCAGGWAPAPPWRCGLACARRFMGLCCVCIGGYIGLCILCT